MKSKVLQTIYRVFDNWSHQLPDSCSPSCSLCCTDNVTITAAEGVNILRFIVGHGRSGWFAEALAGAPRHQAARITTNEFALACLEGRDSDPENDRALAACPFLGADRLCQIYLVRPFACRVFASVKKCCAGQPALMPDYYFEAATAFTQLIEHLGQKEYWGNMLDVLPALLDIGEFRDIGLLLPPGQVLQSKLHTLTARPLPGFLFSEENAEQVSALLQTVFATVVDGKTVEDFLNGR